MTSGDNDVIKVSRSLTQVDLSRRSLLKRGIALGLSAPVFASLIAACADDDDADDTGPAAEDPDDDETIDEEPTDDADEEPVDEPDEDDDAAHVDDTDDAARYGGTLNVALTGDPPGLDIQWILGGTMTLIGMHIWETLLTWDEEFEPVPDLAEAFEVSDEGLTITIPLREGVLFHNGEEMVADDVIASIERWGSLSARAEGFVTNYDTMEALDDYTVEIRMNQSLGPLSTLLARYPACCGIYPASVIEASDEHDLAEIVGTGPYKFVEWIADQHVHLERFEEYSSRDEEPSGYAGRKYQYLDEIFFIPVPNEASRVAGLQAGDYHYLQEVGSDYYETLDDDPSVVAEIPAPTAPVTWILNLKEGVLANQTLRQAILAAIDVEELLIAGYGAGDFTVATPSITLPETAWYTEAGIENYNQADPERARELAEEAGYDGEPIRFMTSQERQALYNMAVVTTQQLEDAGFNIDLQVMDWATLQERRDIPDDWEIFTTTFGFFPDPIMIPNIAGSTWAGWWDTPRKNELAEEFWTESDPDRRFEIWEELQALAYEEVPQLSIGHASNLMAYTATLQNPPHHAQLGAMFTNSWLDE